MRRFLVIAATAACSAAVACSAAAFHDTTAADQLAKALAGHVPGQKVECINAKMTSGPQIVGNHTLLYRQGSTIWRTDVIGRCPSLEEGVTLITDIYGGQLCHNDRFRTLAPGETIPSAYCRIGSFTAYTPAPGG